MALPDMRQADATETAGDGDGTETGVVLDVCSAHGTWFDRGELARAVQFHRSGVLHQQARTDAERDLGLRAEHGAAGQEDPSAIPSDPRRRP